MSDDPNTAGDACLGGHTSAGTSIPRRRFLAGLGASGLVVAEALFGRTAAAEASGDCSCCNLVYCPPNTTYDSCTSTCHYLWGCAGSGTITCNCCEKKNCSTGAYYASAYTCWVH
jgi:hypothetical protein